MKKIKCLSVLLALCLSLTACQPYSPGPDNDVGGTAAEQTTVDTLIPGCRAEDYRMDITLDTENDIVNGTTVVKLTNTTDEALDRLCFRLYSANISSGTVNSASNADTGNEYGINVRKDPSVIYLSLNGDTLQPGGSLSVKLDFQSQIPEAEDRFGVHVEEKGKLYNLTFCFPQIAFLKDGKWSEAKYADNGESYCNAMTDYHVTLNAPSDYVVLSSGESETVDGKTVIEAPNVREMAISACNFATIKSLEANGITFNILAVDYPATYPEYLSDLYHVALTVAIEAVKLYSEKVGPYIYDELDIIPMRFENYGGMEMPGLIQVEIPLAQGNDPEDYLCTFTAVATAHEVGHQWFYGAVGNDAAHEPWLDESFTSYLEYLYCDQFQAGKEAVVKFNYQYTGRAVYAYGNYGFSDGDEFESEAYINLPIYNYNFFTGQSYHVVYHNGAWFLRELELTMGSEDFFTMLSDWYSTNQNQIVTGRAFIAHVLVYDSSQAVRDVINEYISEKAL